MNVCLLDLSKAFDKMNHSALFIKLMDRLIPVQVLSILENWFAIIIIITDEYDLGGTVALLLQDHLTLLIVSHVTTNQSTTA